MLHKETVTKGTLDLINRLMADDQLKPFYLVGGTALALMIGHRVSIDIDLFTDRKFDAPNILEYLSKSYQLKLISLSNNSITGFIEDIKFDLISHRYPHVQPIVTIEGIRMAGLLDIAAMKVNAIVGNGTRIKDFIDTHYLLKEIPYQEVLKAYSKKYPDANPRIARASLLYYEDIDFTTEVIFLKERLKWKDVKKAIKDAMKKHHP